MFCPKCGASIPDGVVEEKKEKKGKNVVKSILLVLLILVLMVGSSVGTAVFIKLQNNVSGTTYEGKGFDTPEEAAQAYAEAFANKDINEIFSCCAIESYVDNYDYVAQLERFGAYNPLAYGGPVMTGDDDAARQLDIEERKAQLTNLIMKAYLRASLSSESPIFSGLVYKLGDGEEYEAEDFVEMLRGTSEISSIKVGDVSDAYDYINVDQTDTHDKYRKAIQKVYGGKIESFAVELEIEGDDWVMFIDAIQYNDKWYILTPQGQGAMISGLDSNFAGICEVEYLEDKD